MPTWLMKGERSSILLDTNPTKPLWTTSWDFVILYSPLQSEECATLYHGHSCQQAGDQISQHTDHHATRGLSQQTTMNNTQETGRDPNQQRIKEISQKQRQDSSQQIGQQDGQASRKTDRRDKRQSEVDNKDFKRKEQMRQEEEASERYMKKYPKYCPDCKIPGEKVDGCDAIRCPICEHHYCWDCLADQGKILRYYNDRHSKKCRHYR